MTVHTTNRKLYVTNTYKEVIALMNDLSLWIELIEVEYNFGYTEGGVTLCRPIKKPNTYNKVRILKSTIIELTTSYTP